MSQIVLISEDQNLVDILTANLKIYIDTQVISFQSISKGITFFKYNTAVSLVICQHQESFEVAYPELLEVIHNEQMQTPLLLLGESKVLTEAPPMLQFKRSFVDLVELVDRIADLLGYNFNKNDCHIFPYYPISIEQCLVLKKTPCDVYIMLKKRGAPDYIKRFQAADQIELNDISGYMKKGLKHLYITVKDRYDFLKQIALNTVESLNDINLDLDTRLQITENSVTTIQELASDPNQDNSEELRKVVKANLSSSVQIIKRQKGVAHLLKHLFANQSGYLFKHAQLITYVAHHSLAKIEWGTTEQAEKIGFCALFHDIFLKKDELAKVHDEAALNALKISPSNKDLIRRHAVMASNAVKHMDLAPPDVAQIILQHHGVVTGTGFAKAHASTLAPLSIVFIVIEEFVARLLSFEDSPTEEFSHIAPQIIKDLMSFYNKPKYLEVVKSLESLSF